MSSESSPIEAYLETKEAGWASGIAQGAKNIFSPQNLGATAAATAMATGMDIPGQVARKAYYAVTKGRDFRAMMGSSPDLKSLQREDPKQFNAHYTSLRNLNPQFASDPIVAGSYMRQMSLAPESAGKVIVESLGGLPREAPGTKPKDLFMPSPMDDLQRQKLKADIPATESKHRLQQAAAGKERENTEAGQRMAGMAKQMGLPGVR